MNITEKVELKMSALESMMNKQTHLEAPSIVAESIESLSMYWEYMSDEDKDYVDCASDALKAKRKWEV